VSEIRIGDSTDEYIDSATDYAEKLSTGDLALCNRDTLLNTLQEWLYIDDIEALDILEAAAISHYLPGEPVWLFFIGPPGGTKTELLRAFRGEPFYSISSLTPQTLISGLNVKGTVDLLPQLDNKILIIKDFTSVLSRDSKEQAQIFADLRDSYDGYLEKAFGSGVGKKSYHAKFDLIAGVTPAIDMYRVVHGILGERFLKCRIHTDEARAIDKAAELMGKEEDMRAELAYTVGSAVAFYAERARAIEVPGSCYAIFDQIKALGNITAKLRSEVARDRYHSVLYYPQAEIGTRLTKQLLKLGQALAVYREHDEIGDEELHCLLRVARDSIPRQRLELVQALNQELDFVDSKHAGDSCNTPTQTAKESLEDIWMLKLIDRHGTETFTWKLAGDTCALLAKSRLLEGTLLSEKVNTQNPMCGRMNYDSGECSQGVCCVFGGDRADE